jgi:hypothetical protein
MPRSARLYLRSGVVWYAGSVMKWIPLLVLTLGACGGSGTNDAPIGKEPITAPYLVIQTTLANDSIDDLSRLSARVITAAEPVQAQPGVGDVIAGAGRVAALDIDTARASFEKVSMGLITYLKQHPPSELASRSSTAPWPLTTRAPTGCSARERSAILTTAR